MTKTLYYPGLATFTITDDNDEFLYEKRLVIHEYTIKTSYGAYEVKFVTLYEASCEVRLSEGDEVVLITKPQKTMYAVVDEEENLVGYEIEGMPEIDWSEHIKKCQKEQSWQMLKEYENLPASLDKDRQRNN